MESPQMPTSTDAQSIEKLSYHKIYNLLNREQLSRNRLANYHWNNHGIPPEFLESYIENRQLYNAIKKNKDTVDLDLILYLLDLGKN